MPKFTRLFLRQPTEAFSTAYPVCAPGFSSGTTCPKHFTQELSTRLIFFFNHCNWVLLMQRENKQMTLIGWPVGQNRTMSDSRIEPWKKIKRSKNAAGKSQLVATVDTSLFKTLGFTWALWKLKLCSSNENTSNTDRHHIVPYSLYTSSIWQQNYLQTDRLPAGRPPGYLSPKPSLECSGNWPKISQFRPSAKCSQDTLNPHFHMSHLSWFPTIWPSPSGVDWLLFHLSAGCIQPSTHCFLVPSMFMITQIHGHSVCYGETH